MTGLVKTYDMSGLRKPSIDGVEVDWPIAVDGPLLEPRDERHHVLWLPILVEGAMPRQGRPEATRDAAGPSAGFRGDGDERAVELEESE